MDVRKKNRPLRGQSRRVADANVTFNFPSPNGPRGITFQVDINQKGESLSNPRPVTVPRIHRAARDLWITLVQLSTDLTEP